MKKTDIGVVGFMYAVCAFFLVMTLKLKKAAQIYPFFIITVLFMLTAAYTVKMVFMYRSEGAMNDVSQVFSGFKGKQFFTMLGFSIIYLGLMRMVGFYLSSLVYLVGTLLFFKVPKKHIAITSVVMALLVYCAFTLFLKVPLPVGLLFR